MRRFKVTIVYEVDTTVEGNGGILGQHLSYLIAAHTRGEDTANQVEEIDFSFKETTHPKDSDAPAR